MPGYLKKNVDNVSNEKLLYCTNSKKTNYERAKKSRNVVERSEGLNYN